MGLVEPSTQVMGVIGPPRFSGFMHFPAENPAGYSLRPAGKSETTPPAEDGLCHHRVSHISETCSVPSFPGVFPPIQAEWMMEAAAAMPGASERSAVPLLRVLRRLLTSAVLREEVCVAWAKASGIDVSKGEPGCLRCEQQTRAKQRVVGNGKACQAFWLCFKRFANNRHAVWVCRYSSEASSLPVLIVRLRSFEWPFRR